MVMTLATLSGKHSDLSPNTLFPLPGPPAKAEEPSKPFHQSSHEPPSHPFQELPAIPDRGLGFCFPFFKKIILRLLNSVSVYTILSS